MKNLKIFVIAICLSLILSGCGSSFPEVEPSEEVDLKTELLTLYYPDGSKEEITFEWYHKSEYFAKASSATIGYWREEKPGKLLKYAYSDAVCFVSDGTVMYQKEGSTEYKLFSGTFTLETTN